MTSLAIVKYHIPEDIGEPDCDILFELILDRINSVITGECFDLNIEERVYTHNKVLELYKNPDHRERIVDIYADDCYTLTHIFKDIEAQPSYKGTVSSLNRENIKNYQITVVTSKYIHIRYS